MDYFFIAPLPSYITGTGNGLRAQSAKTSSLNQLLIHGEGVRWRYDFTGEQVHVAQARGACPLWPGYCCKSRKLHRSKFFGQTPKREAIDDSYILSRVTEVAYEFSVSRRGPSDLYTKNAPAALGIFDTLCKTTFVTISPEQRTQLGHSAKSERCQTQTSRPNKNRLIRQCAAASCQAHTYCPIIPASSCSRM